MLWTAVIWVKNNTQISVYIPVYSVLNVLFHGKHEIGEFILPIWCVISYVNLDTVFWMCYFIGGNYTHCIKNVLFLLNWIY